MADYSRFAAALASAAPQPQAAFAALQGLAEELVGVKLFTIMTYDAATGEAGRIYSNMSDAYPVSGTKPANPTDWTRQVIDRQQMYVANDDAGIEAVFFDHALIKSLGCASVINLPVVVGGVVLGTINCLHQAGYYTPDKVAAVEGLRLPGAACLMLQARVLR